jgi:AraC family transcriptional regulator, ethanolamine operon transcriptional activator
MPPPVDPSACPTATPAVAARHHRHSVDVDEHAQAQPDWRLSYDQLSPGRFSGEVEHLLLPGLRVVRETANRATRQRGAFGDLGEQQLGLGMVHSGHGESLFAGQRLGRSAVMVGGGDRLDLLTPPDFDIVAVVVDRSLLAGLWERLYQRPLQPSWLEHQVVVPARPEAATTLRGLHVALLQTVQQRPEVLLQLRDAILLDWIGVLPDRVDVSGLRTVQRRQRVVQRACELMLSRPDQPMTTLALCSHIGASPRKLDYCFRDVLGISPALYLRTVRLNAVRRELKRRDPRSSVQDVAARWGFWHPGQFSASYKRQFGELPSQTVRSAEAPRHGASGHRTACARRDAQVSPP